MSFVVRKPGAGLVTLDDLGLTVTGLAGSERDFRDLEAADIAASDDLATEIAAGNLVILDPRDDSTALSIADGELARVTANDTHFGVNGGRFGTLDAPGTVITDKFIIEYDDNAGKFVQIPISTALIGGQETIGAIVGAMGQDGTDTTFVFNASNNFIIASQDETKYDGTGINGSFVGGDGAGGTAYSPGDTITLSDGTVVLVDAVDGNDDVTQFTVTSSGGVSVTTGVALTQSSTSGTGTDFTLTPEICNVTAGSLQWDTDDVFLRNTGDTLDSGTLTIASGATLAIATGGDLTIADLPVNPDDAANKEYVDSVAAGLDPKESVRYCTVIDVAGTYAAGGGTAASGEFTAVDFTNGAIFDGLTGGAIQIDDRILVKTQGDHISGFADAAIAGAPAGSVVPGIAAATYDFDVNIDGGGNSPESITTSGGEDYDGIAALMSAQVTGGTVAFVGGAFRVTSDSFGTSSTVVVAVGTAASGGGDLFAAITAAAGGNPAITFPAPTAGTSGALENGIYVVTTAGAAGVMERATDQDGTPSDEVSGGNFTFVENGTVCENTGWVLQGDGELTLNTDVIVWVQFSESTNIQPGVGISQGGPDFDLDLNDTLGDAEVAGGDLVGFHDLDGTPAGSGSGSQTYSRSFDDIISDLDIVTHGGGNGILVQTGSGEFATVDIAVNGAGALDGLAISNGSGVSGDPTLGLDIQNLPTQGGTDSDDRVAVWDATAGVNVYYTIGDIASAVGASDSFATWAAAGNTSGDGSIVADSGTDTATLTGGIGITIDFDAGTDTLVYTFTRAGMADTAVEGADTVPFFDNSNSEEPEYRAWSDIISDLDIATLAFTTIAGDTGTAVADTASDTLNLVGATNGGITTTASDAPETVVFSITPIDLTTGAATLATGDFIVVSDSADSATTLALKYTFGDMISDLGILTGISASIDEDLLGIDVTGTVVGLDILNLSDPGDDMAPTDEFPLHDKSEGTTGANRKITGTNIAEGTAAILGIETLTFDVFPAVTSPADDQTLLAYTDGDRSKVLSVESHTYVFSDNTLNDNDWMDIGDATDALSGFVMPLDGTVVSATAHTENANSNTYDLDLYIDAVDSGSIANLTGAGEDTDSDPTLDINFSAGQKLRVRADRTAGTTLLGDTVVVLTVRWRS